MRIKASIVIGLLVFTALSAGSVDATPIPFSQTIDFSEYAFPQATNDTGIVVQAADGSSTVSYNILKDDDGTKLLADDGGADDLTITYTASTVAPNSPADRPDIRFRLSGGSGSQITGRTSFEDPPSSNNLGNRSYYEVRVLFASHLEVTDLSLLLASLNTAGISWEFSELYFLDEDDSYFSAPTTIDPYLASQPGQTGSASLGNWLSSSTDTVQDVGTDQTSVGSNPAGELGLTVTASDVGLSGQRLGGFVWRTTLEDVRGINNGATNFSSSLREFSLSGNVEVEEQSSSGISEQSETSQDEGALAPTGDSPSTVLITALTLIAIGTILIVVRRPFRSR